MMKQESGPVSQTGRTSGSISPRTNIRHHRGSGVDLFIKTVCAARDTQRSLSGLAMAQCLRPSTLRAVPSSPSAARCELINHSNELSRRERGRPATSARAGATLGGGPVTGPSQSNNTTPHLCVYRYFCTFLNVAVLSELLGILTYTHVTIPSSK